MLNTHTLTIDGRTWPLRFTKGSLSRAEFELGVGLIGPGAVKFWEPFQPVEGETDEQRAQRILEAPGQQYRLAVLAYAGTDGKAGTLDELLETVDFQHMKSILSAVTDFFQSLEKKTIAATTTPVTTSQSLESNSGSASGPTPVSRSASRQKNSGR